ncbi:heme-binding protein 2-like [Cheilinus undulatus]|uniref:heme-binding protein 2-like n=1 Tax=Cheilinus undulatus TaxID=241271 RepID=UPI001BD63BF4|nr:heme-binding protein 2-like [Cheilinus undulatus]
MLFLSGLVGALLVLTAEARVGNSSESKYCSETAECLLYDLVCKTDKYEARHYSSVKWVSTEETAYAMEFAVSNAFHRLFRYISGENEEGMKIKMTAPVVTKMPDNTSFWEKRVYTMSFLLPSEQQKNPPMPTDDKVFIDEWPELNVYVQGYGGWMTSLSDKMKYNSLSSALDTAGEKYIKDYHFAVGYNSPMKWFNRHNEVWLVAVDEPECSSSEELDFSFPFFD